MTSEIGKKIVKILKDRDGIWTKIILKDGREIETLNIVWGYDLGDEYAHITTNISPESKEQIEYDIIFFYSNEVAKLTNPIDDTIIYQVD